MQYWQYCVILEPRWLNLTCQRQTMVLQVSWICLGPADLDPARIKIASWGKKALFVLRTEQHCLEGNYLEAAGGENGSGDCEWPHTLTLTFGVSTRGANGRLFISQSLANDNHVALVLIPQSCGEVRGWVRGGGGEWGGQSPHSSCRVWLMWRTDLWTDGRTGEFL